MGPREGPTLGGVVRPGVGASPKGKGVSGWHHPSPAGSGGRCRGGRQSPCDWEHFCHLQAPRVEHAGLWPEGCECPSLEHTNCSCPPCRGQARGSLGMAHLSVLFVRALEGCFLSLANVCVVKVEGTPYLCKTDEVGEICVNSSATATAYYGLLGITKNIFEVRAWSLLCAEVESAAAEGWEGTVWLSAVPALSGQPCVGTSWP